MTPEYAVLALLLLCLAPVTALNVALIRRAMKAGRK